MMPVFKRNDSGDGPPYPVSVVDGRCCKHCEHYHPYEYEFFGTCLHLSPVDKSEILETDVCDLFEREQQ